MPSDKNNGWGYNYASYRVKQGRHTVFSSAKKGDAKEFIRKNKALGKLRLVPPNA